MEFDDRYKNPNKIINHQLRDDINKDVIEFLKKGGEIKNCNNVLVKRKKNFNKTLGPK